MSTEPNHQGQSKKVEENEEKSNNSSQKPEENPVPKQQFQKQFQMHQKQQKQIREEMQAQSPLIGQIFPLTLLMSEFQNNNGFYIKIHHLLSKYEKYRKTRRDGSCFYRALAYSIFNKIVLKGDKNLQEHMLKKIKGAKEHLLKAQFQGIIFQDLQEIFIQKLDKKLPINEEQILKMFRDPEESNYIVLFLRFLTSGELKNNAILYETFIDNEIPIQMFCQIEVEPIDKEADQIQIMALLNYLEVGIKIVYLDASNSPEPYTCILPESFSEDHIICQLLYRPGHYDILFK